MVKETAWQGPGRADMVSSCHALCSWYALLAVGFKDVLALQPPNVINFLLACDQCIQMLAAGPLERYLLGESSGHGLE